MVCCNDMNTAIVNYGRVLREYGRVLRTRWRWIVWGVLLTLVATTVFLFLWPPLYRSDATVFVRTPGDVSRVRDGGDSYAQTRARTYAVLASSRSMSERIIADMGLDMKPETLAGRIEAQNRSGTALMDIAVSAPSPGEAQHTATILLSEFGQTVRSLESVPGSLVPRAELVVVDPPRPAVRVVAWGTPISYVLLGAVLLGAFLGSMGAVIRSIFAPSTQAEPSDTDPHIEANALHVSEHGADDDQLPTCSVSATRALDPRSDSTAG